jgi:zinc finger protein
MTMPIDPISTLRCPSCDTDSMSLSQSQYDVEHFGAVLLNVATCQKCGYKHTDVTTLTEREPIALTVRITSIEDLNIRVIKSGTATLSIPEFRATITPGPYSEGYVSNVEGVLEKIEDALTFMLASANGKRLERGKRMLKRMRTAREYKPHFSLEIRDPFGNSALVSPKPGKIAKRKLTRSELMRVKFGQYVLAQEAAKRNPLTSE